MSIIETKPYLDQTKFYPPVTVPDTAASLVSSEPATSFNGLGFEVQPCAEAQEAAELPSSRQKFDSYLELREATKLIPKVECGELASIQSDVRGWLLESYPDWDQPGSVEDYSEPNMRTVTQKLHTLGGYLKNKYGSLIGGYELLTTEAFLDATSAMYEDREVESQLNDRDGSFAFLVPMRMSRKYPEYGQEIESIIPTLRYVPNEMRAWMMRGLPPFVADVYNRDETTGKRGYLVCAPSITEDMKDDLAQESMATYMNASQDVVNQAVDFAADRLGVRVVGLGATIPAITKYGQSIKRPDVITTTGHGGTVELICGIIDSFTGEESKKVGVIGLGTIGAAAAVIAADRYRDHKIHIFDTAPGKIKKLYEKSPDNFAAAADASEVIRQCNVIVSAVTEPLRLNEEDMRHMEGTLVVDDSQPASVDPESVARVEAAGGNVVWAIGRDVTRTTARSGYDYGTMADGRTDLFGCEAEAAVLARYQYELEASGRSPERARDIVGRIAIQGPVTAYSAGIIGALFKKYGIGPAEPQAFGRRVNLTLAA